MQQDYLLWLLDVITDQLSVRGKTNICDHDEPIFQLKNYFFS